MEADSIITSKKPKINQPSKVKIETRKNRCMIMRYG